VGSSKIGQKRVILFEIMSFFFKKFRSFTLIELLVVIGIIGILASLTLAVIMEVRDRGKDTRIQTSLAQVRFEAALIQSRDGSYTNLCDGSNTLNDTNDNLLIIENDVRKFIGSDPDCYVNVDGQSYCVQSDLIRGGVYCLDSTGYAGTDATNCAAGNISCH